MNVRLSRLLWMLLAVATLALGACEKDDLDTLEETVVPTAPTTTSIVTSPVAARIAQQPAGARGSSSSSDGLLIECIQIDYPFTLLFDSVGYAIASFDDLDAAFAQADTATQFIDFAYPLNITLEDGSAAVAADGNELATLVAACVPDGGWTSGGFPAFVFDDPGCYTLAYPTTLSDDSVNYTVADQTELINTLAANPFLFYEFPLTLVDSTGNAVVVAADENELFGLLANCASTGGGHGGGSGGGVDTSGYFENVCFDFVYPFSVETLSGGSVSVADEGEFISLIFASEFVDFVYPFTVAFADGSTRVIGSQQDYFRTLDDCHGGGGTGPGGDIVPLTFALVGTDSCYALVYPLTLIDSTGAEFAVGSLTEAQQAAAADPTLEVAVPFQLDIAGQVVDVSSLGELEFYLAGCFGGGGQQPIPALFFVDGGLNDGTCYTLVYPFEVIGSDSTFTTIADATGAQAFINQGDIGARLVYPISLTLTSTGATVTAATEEDIYAAVVDCM